MSKISENPVCNDILNKFQRLQIRNGDSCPTYLNKTKVRIQGVPQTFLNKLLKVDTVT